MTCVTLIHGSTQTARCWDLVRPHISAAGHHSIAVELPADRPDLTASDFARVAADQMADDCIVVAHSASGSLLPLIAELRPVRALVFLAAAIPAPGFSMLDQLQKDPEMLSAEWLRAGPSWSDPANWRELADRFLFHDVAPSLLDWAHSTIRVMRLDAAAREPFRPSSVAPVRSLCVICSGDRTINPDWQKRVWRERAPGAPMKILGSGHCPYVSIPRETADAILMMFERSGRG